MVLLLSSIVATAIGVPVVIWFGVSFAKGIYTGVVSENAAAQSYINANRTNPLLIEPFELGVSTANIAKYGPKSLQFIQY